MSVVNRRERTASCEFLGVLPLTDLTVSLYSSRITVLESVIRGCILGAGFILCISSLIPQLSVKRCSSLTTACGSFSSLFLRHSSRSFGGSNAFNGRPHCIFIGFPFPMFCQKQIVQTTVLAVRVVCKHSFSPQRLAIATVPSSFYYTRIY